MDPLNEALLPHHATIRQALERLNHGGACHTLFVVNDDRYLLGSLTDGDIRRGLLSGHELGTKVTEVMNPAPHTLTKRPGWSPELKEMRDQGIRLLPILDDQGRVVRLVDLERTRSVLPVDALIMAGGRGERLRPQTDTIPKPLIPIGGRPIIEHVLELLVRHGITDVSISVNYLRERIMDHLEDGSALGMHIRYVHEEQPLGTAGALSLLKELRQDSLLLMNCDLLTGIALDRMYDRFITAGADLAIATTDHVVDLPYAIMELEDGRVRSFREKPSIAYPCNAGIYLMKQQVVRAVPAGRPYNATDLIQEQLDQGRHVIAYPITEHWIDIGRHEDLERAGQNTAR
ncbi:MAG: nucleotidyltransferase family protein [Flavobacteriales bacterium]